MLRLSHKISAGPRNGNNFDKECKRSYEQHSANRIIEITYPHIVCTLYPDTRQHTHTHTHEASILLPVDQFGGGILYRETPYGRSAPYPQGATRRNSSTVRILALPSRPTRNTNLLASLWIAVAAASIRWMNHVNWLPFSVIPYQRQLLPPTDSKDYSRSLRPHFRSTHTMYYAYNLNHLVCRAQRCR